MSLLVVVALGWASSQQLHNAQEAHCLSRNFSPPTDPPADVSTWASTPPRPGPVSGRGHQPSPAAAVARAAARPAPPPRRLQSVAIDAVGRTDRLAPPPSEPTRRVDARLGRCLDGLDGSGAAAGSWSDAVTGRRCSSGGAHERR